MGVKTAGEHKGEEAHRAEMRAINERLIIASVRQHELAEIASKAAEAALKSEERYRLLAQNFPNGVVFLFDRDLRFLLADGRGLAAVNLSKEATEGKTIWETFSPQTCQQIEPAYRAALAGETVVIEVGFPVENTSQQAPESTERIYQIHVLPVRNEAGTIMAGMAMSQDVTDQRQAAETTQWQAHHDALTGLPNRALLRARLEQVLAISERSGEFAALLFLDVDCFKAINDTFGHAVGDHVLRVVAERLADCLRAEDTVARMGGDEFLLILPSLHVPQDAARVAQKIAALFESPVFVDTHAIPVTVSVGISLFPSDGRDVESLMRSADTAMYQSKKHQHGSYRFFDGAVEAKPTPTEG